VPIVRKYYLTDKDGVEHEIKSQEDLLRILNQMTPEQRKVYNDKYRFTPISNATGSSDYSGLLRDMM
jgi:hypothetical protein